MRRYALVAAVLLLLGGLTLRWWLAPAPVPAVETGQQVDGRAVPRTPGEAPAAPVSPAAPQGGGPEPRSSKAAARVGRNPAREPAAPAPSAVNAAARRDQAVQTWESLIARASVGEGGAAAALAAPAKAAFEQVDRDDQLDCIRAAVDRLPDESFPVLYGILFDRTEDPEVLDAIFSDALNRPEDLKEPLLLKLAQDRAHPLFFESARIVDATGAAEGEDAPTARTPRSAAAGLNPDPRIRAGGAAAAATPVGEPPHLPRTGPAAAAPPAP